MFKDKTGKTLSLVEASPKIISRLYNYWLDLELMLLRWTGHIPFHSIRGLIYRLSGIKIGKGSTVHMWANFFQPNNISIGDGSVVGDRAFLDGRDKLTIGDHVDIASQVLIYNSQHDLQSNSFVATTAPVTIKDYVFIGPRVTILPGVVLGRGSVVAAGAVVTKSVAPMSMVGGVPAKVIGERKGRKLDYKLGRARLFQ